MCETVSLCQQSIQDSSIVLLDREVPGALQLVQLGIGYAGCQIFGVVHGYHEIFLGVPDVDR